MSKKILILPGDGIGQEVTSSAIQILEFIIDKFNLDFSTKILDVGGTAYEKFGSSIPEDVLVSANVKLGKDYPLPIVEIGSSRQKALEAFATTKN